MTNIRFFTLGALALTLLTGCQPAQQESSQTDSDSNVNAPASATATTAANVTQERLLNAAA
jgi:outer membrane biogenesis lipoprotein LolB